MMMPPDGKTSKCMAVLASVEHLDQSKAVEATEKCLRLARLYPSEYRSARGRIMNETPWIEQSPILNDMEKEILDYLHYCRDTFGVHSLLYQTLLRATAPFEKDKRTVEREYRESKSSPPAFDKSMAAPTTAPSREMRRELVRWLRSSNDPYVQELKDIARKELQRLERMRERYIVLTNGTTTSLVYCGYNVNDIIGCMFVPGSFLDRFPNIGRFFKIKNRYCSDDGISYVLVPESYKFDRHGGEHLVIPDKDMKTREIYRMFPWVQVLSKGVHDSLDRIARRLPGNGTYHQQKILVEIVEHRLNQKGSDCTIIGTDMSKYSDTLQRSFIMEIMSAIGFPVEVVKELDELYSLPIWDPIKQCTWENTDATYQGQYGDFPMITIANITLQNFMFHWNKIERHEPYNSAVGDDCIVIMRGRHIYVKDYMTKVYGCVGVRINEDKTSILYNGEGAVDFVKKQIDSTGILGFLNLRAVKSGNWDRLIEDILTSHLDQDQKVEFLEKFFYGIILHPGDLCNISVINGGLSEHVITAYDLAQFCARVLEMRKRNKPRVDETRKCLEAIKVQFHENLDYLYDTPLYGFLTQEDVTYLKEHPGVDVDEWIIKRILNMVSIGFRTGEIKNLTNLMGADPRVLKVQYEEWLDNHNIDDPVEDPVLSVWKSIQEYESFVANRDKQVRQHDGERLLRLASTDYSNHPVFSDFAYSHVSNNTLKVADYEAIDDALGVVRDYEKTVKVLSLKGFVREEVYFGISYWYYYHHLPHGNTQKYRLYGVVYNSNYYLLPQSIYDSAFKPILKMEYWDFIKRWDYINLHLEESRALLRRCQSR